MTAQQALFESPYETRAAAMAEAHRQGKFYNEAGLTLPPSQAAVPARHRARTEDPRSSKATAEEVTTTGRAEREAAQVLAALRNHPATTSKELAEYSGLDYHMIARRLPELRDIQHVVEHGPDRVCRAPGSSTTRPVLTWLPVNPYAPNGGPRLQHAPEETSRLRPTAAQLEPEERTAP